MHYFLLFEFCLLKTRVSCCFMKLLSLKPTDINRSDQHIHSFHVRTFLWFQWFWSRTQRVPLCWGRNAALRRLCKQTFYFLNSFPAEYQIFQLRRDCGPDSEHADECVWLTWRSWPWWPSCCCRFVGCCRGRSAGWTGSSSSRLPDPRLPPSRSSFSLNHKESFH